MFASQITSASRRLVPAVALASGLLFRPACGAPPDPGLQPIGAVATVAAAERGVTLSCTDGATVQLTVLAPDLVRVRVRFAGQPAAPDHSWAVERTDWDRVPWQLAETADTVMLTTAGLEVVVRRSPLLVEFRDAATHRVVNADERPMARDPATGALEAAKRLGLDEHFYGLGEKAAPLDHRRGTFTMWNSDTPGYVAGTDPIYQSVPFYLGLADGAAYGLFFDNSWRSTFDFGHLGQEAAIYRADGGELNYYFFAGPDLKQILGRYTELTGRMPLPPLWVLGNQQSRYSYYPDTMVEQIVARYRRERLPLDVLYLDIHYMDGYRDFTWNPQRFPDPRGLLDRLRAQGVKVVTIIDPGVKYQPAAPDAPAGAHYSVFDQGQAGDYFLRRRDGSLWIGEVWPGKAVYTDYTRADARRWWGDLHRPLLEAGVAGIWDDMNEPSDFTDQTGRSQADVVFDDLGAHTPYAANRNVFALNEVRATYEGLTRLQPERRPFILTRAGYAGVQRYAAMWTGDNNATWDALALNIPMFASLGLSGETFVGADIPGFIGRATPELLVRSYELACLVPLLRNHAAIDNYDHEPWRFGPVYAAIIRRYLQLRYRLLPYLYTTMEAAHRTGVPLFRPLVLNFQDDPNTFNLDDEFMAGDALLSAPVLRPGVRGREVYLPAGPWYDYWSGQPLSGGRLLWAEADLDHLPLYVRGGSVLPSTEAMDFVGAKPWDPLLFDVYPGADGTAAGSLYEDDGVSPAYRDGAFRRTAVTYAAGSGGARLTLGAPEGRYAPGTRHFEFTLHAAPAATSVALDGRALPRLAPGAGGDGWWPDETGALHVRLADDSQVHALTFR
ncbi:MAG TPA: TIM-barrel domain-containing protein [Opitutaceae bacterium]|nr:TIM-barrel domain-containing protein [Opitutaceae bacterium]